MKLNIHDVDYPSIRHNNIRLSMARLDEFMPLASGNKYFKLDTNFKSAQQKGIRQLISFGGAFSNHIHALALFGQQAGFNTLGIIRGEPQSADIYRNNPTLSDAEKAGMELHFVDRKEYRLRNDKTYLENLQQQYPNALIIPEGGSNPLAVAGCKEISRLINTIESADIITVACGTGATLAGIASGLHNNQLAVGYSVLCDKSMKQRITTFINNENALDQTNWKLENADYGGYAKLDMKLIDFIVGWLEQTGILLDPIYTSKMCMRLLEQMEAGEFPPGTSICMIHSGGLQGWRGMKKKVVRLAGKETWHIIEKNLI